MFSCSGESWNSLYGSRNLRISLPVDEFQEGVFPVFTRAVWIPNNTNQSLPNSLINTYDVTAHLPVDSRVGYGMPPDMADGRAPEVRRPPQRPIMEEEDDDSDNQLGITNQELREMVVEANREWRRRWDPY